MTSPEPGLLDTNVLVYGVNPDAPNHAAARLLIEGARDPSATLYISAQIVCEFYSVITNPRRVVAPCSPLDAMNALSALLSLPGIRVLPSPAEVIQKLIGLLKQRPVTGPDIFDLQLVATMQANGVDRIYTYNPEDFRAFPRLTVVVPT